VVRSSSPDVAPETTPALQARSAFLGRPTLIAPGLGFLDAGFLTFRVSFSILPELAVEPRLGLVAAGVEVRDPTGGTLGIDAGAVPLMSEFSTGTWPFAPMPAIDGYLGYAF
jgi:hypothetical protein